MAVSPISMREPDQPAIVSVVIPARVGQETVAAADACEKLWGRIGGIDCWIARGRQPSAQRNRAVRAAVGGWIYFLDDDSIPDAGNLDRAGGHFERPDVVAVGGPSLCLDGATERQRDFAAVTTTWLAFGPSRARYKRIGSVRSTGEKELILCNLAIRRSAFLEAGGLDESLYPNEENALMDKLRQRGGQLLYDPEFSVQRPPRATIRAFVKMVWTYGRGRAEQFRQLPTQGSILNFVPALLVLGTLTLPWWPTPLRWGYLAYGLAVLVQATVTARQEHRNVFRIAALVVICHFAYGCGFWRGLITRLKPFEERLENPILLEHRTLHRTRHSL